MKVAILLTGNLRTVEMVKHLHMNSLIKPYNADVFLGIDTSNKLQVEYQNPTEDTEQQLVKDTIDFFKPIDTFILDTFSLEGVPNNDIRRFRQYYVVKNSYRMLKKHMENTNTKYDVIMRLRFDQYIFSQEVPVVPGFVVNNLTHILYNQENTDTLKKYSLDKKFTFEEVNPNTIYVFGFGNFEHYKYSNDQFFYHDESLIDKMFMFYDNMLELMKYCLKKKIGNKGCMTECIFYTYITNNQITIKRSNISGVFIRGLLTNFRIEPSLLQHDKEMFYRYLDKTGVYFEYGSGGSTYQASIRDKITKMYSVESDPDWHKQLKTYIKSNKITHIFNDMDTIPNTWGHPGKKASKEQRISYSNHIRKLSKKEQDSIDLVVIDGRFRVACCLNCYDVIRDDCLIAFDDFLNRPKYYLVLEYFSIVEKTDDDRMIILKKKKGMTIPKQLIEKYELNAD